MTKTKPFSQLLDPIEADPARRAQLGEHRRAIDDALALAELRNRVSMTRGEVGRELDVSQAKVSRIEHGDDLYLSTLRRYVEALGGRLVLQAVFPDLTVNLLSGEPAKDIAIASPTPDEELLDAPIAMLTPERS